MDAEIQAGITATLNELNLGAGQKGFADLRAGICELGFDVDALRAVTRHLKATKTDWEHITVQNVIDAYSAKVTVSDRTNSNCDHCHGCGWLKPVLIEGKYHGYTKTFIVNYFNPGKYFKFVKANQTFRAFAGLLPCSCDNGTAHNHRFSDPWLSDSQRAKVTGFCVKGQGADADDIEDYYQGELIRCLNLAAEGKEYTSRKLKEYPQSIEELQQLLMKTLGEVGA